MDTNVSIIRNEGWYEKDSKWKVLKEFRVKAAKLVTEGGLSVPEAGRRLSLPTSTLNTWVRAYKSGKLVEVKNQKPLSDAELARVRRELAEVKMEQDIFKKAAAYFAKESLPGMR